MKLALMQPYFFPYLGYFGLIRSSDRFIVFDTPQFMKGGWINRNRILHPCESWQYITVPLKKHPLKTPIKDLQISPSMDWQAKIMGQIEHYKRTAPHYRQIHELLRSCIEVNETSISRLNVCALERVSEYIGIEFHYEYFSEISLNLGPVEKSSDWALRISEAVGADEYINSPGGVNLYDPAEFLRHSIKLAFCPFPALVYECRGYQFTPSLSIIDVLMWNSSTEIRKFLDMQECLSPGSRYNDE